MAAKPAEVCILEKEKLLDVQKGFVDTFNWIVSFCENLKGEKGVTVDKEVSDRPVIKLGDDEEGDGGETTGGGVKVVGTDKSTNWPADDADDYETPAQTITFASADDSNVKVTVEGDKKYAKVTIGVYYK